MVGFISFHFGLLHPFAPSFPFILAFSFATFVCLGLGHFLKASAGGAVVWACVPSAVLPRSFRAASAKHRSKTGNQTHKRSDLATLHPKIKFQHGTWKLSYIRIFKFIFYLLIPYCTLPTSPSATFREGHPSAKLPRPEPCAFFNE